MIASSTRGSSPQAIGRYLHGRGHNEEHHYDQAAHGRVIGGNIQQPGASSESTWARTMSRVIGRHDRPLKGAVYQVSLRAAPGDRVLSNAEWREAARIWLHEQGADFQPYVIVRHAPDHVHLVVSRVGFDGSVWHAQRDYARNERACRKIEQRFGLKPVRSSREAHAAARKGEALSGRETRAERAMKKRGEVPRKEKARRVIDQATKGKTSTIQQLKGRLGYLYGYTLHTSQAAGDRRAWLVVDGHPVPLHRLGAEYAPARLEQPPARQVGEWQQAINEYQRQQEQPKAPIQRPRQRTQPAPPPQQPRGFWGKLQELKQRAFGGNPAPSPPPPPPEPKPPRSVPLEASPAPLQMQEHQPPITRPQQPAQRPRQPKISEAQRVGLDAIRAGRAPKPAVRGESTRQVTRANLASKIEKKAAEKAAEQAARALLMPKTPKIPPPPRGLTR